MDAAFIRFDMPVMGMAKNVSLHLLARTNDVKKSDRVFQTEIAGESGIVMNQNQRRLIRVGIK